ncbi:hypothetical protein D0T49_13000 [Paludibacter sp. 221]|nr:hypothetical protein [Paludibacter sp. 221]
MKYTFYIIILFFLLLFNGCEKTKHLTSDLNFKSIDVNPDNAREKIFLSDIYSDIDYIPPLPRSCTSWFAR